ncbi:hypothetical protein TSMEX_001476 [Taenia solium]|eukprot:TsM_000111800 transcript=TsM_000111800 gene=TsM_000111800
MCRGARNTVCPRKGMQVWGSGAFAKRGCYGRKFCPHRAPQRNFALFGSVRQAENQQKGDHAIPGRCAPHGFAHTHHLNAQH